MTPHRRSALTNQLGYLVILGALLLGGLIGLRNVSSLATTESAVSRSHIVLRSIAGLMSTLKDAETGQRGFLLVGADRYLDPYRAALRRVASERHTLAALVNDNETQKRRLVALSPIVDRRLAQLARTVALAQTNQAPAALAFVRTDSGEFAMDSIRRALDEMSSIEFSLLAQRSRDAASNRRFALGSMILSGIVGALLILIIATITTRRMRDESASSRVIAEQRDRLRTTLASIGDAVVSTDTAGLVESMNGVAEVLTGWSSVNARGKPLAAIFRIVNEDTRHPVENPVDRALREGAVVGLANHTILIALDGTEVFIDDSAAPIRSDDGTITGCVLVFRDIGDQKRDERQIAASEARFRSMSENIAPLTWIAEADGSIYWYSKRWYDYTGSAPEEMRGTGWMKAHHPDYADGVLERFRAATAAGSTWEDVFPLRGSDGSYRWFLSRATPIRDAQGEPAQWIGSNTDITDERAATEALRLSDTRYRTALQAVNSLIWTNDPSGRMVGDQPWWSAFTGQTFDEYQGFGWADAVHPDDAQPTIDRWNGAVSSSSMFVFEHRVRRYDGAWRTCTIRALPVLGNDGAIHEWVGVHTDVTNLRAAAERERSLIADASLADAKFRALFDQGAYFAGIMDPDGTIIEPNRQSWEEPGFAREDIVGRKFWDGPWWRESAEIQQLVRAASMEAAAGATVRRELAYTTADGSARVVDMIIVPIRDEDGRVLFLAPTGNDITDRVAAQRQLRETALATQRLAAIVASSADAIIATNLDGIVTNWNRAATQIFEFTESDIVGRPIIVLMPPELGSSEDVIMQKTLLGESVTAYDTVRLAKSGARVPLSITISPIVDGRGQLIGASTIARDITERKHSEEKLRRSEEELRRIASALSEADHRKDEFLATLAHELRNPLAPIRNGLQIMRIAGNDKDAMQRSQAMIERQTDHLVRLVDDLMDISRISRGTIALREEQLDLNSVLRHAVETSRPLINDKQQLLTVDTGISIIPVLGDRTRLTQIFSNLLNNASRYTNKGGSIAISAEASETSVEVRVRDSGIGIPREMLVEIFEMFAQVDRSLERSQSGLGIGLTLVKRLVEMHGGRVEAKSAGLGHGSEFIVHIPITEIALDVTPRQARAVTAPTPRRKVLVVDDNLDSAQSLGSVLSLMGHEVRLANDGLEALSAAEAFRPDVIMLDIGMPRLNGYEACRAIRGRPWAVQTRIIALTGWGQPDDRQRSLDAGFNQHLVKPVDSHSLQAVLSD